MLVEKRVLAAPLEAATALPDLELPTPARKGCCLAHPIPKV